MDGSAGVLFGASTGEELSAIASASTSSVANAGPATQQLQFQSGLGGKQQKRKRNRAILFVGFRFHVYIVI